VLLNEHQRLVPHGAIGELCIAGPQIATGYVADAARTSEVFVRDEAAVADGQRLYRSGDLARWTSEGELVLVGRKDLQIKLRGQRIELGEVAEAFRRHPAVEQAEALLTERKPGSPELVVAVRLGSHEPEPSLQAFAANLLPKAMLPSRIVVLEAIPLLASGKLDRERLALGVAAALRESAGDAPIGPTEERVAQVFAEVLGTSIPNRHESFFAAGGHSLLALRATLRLSEELGKQVSLADLFSAPTVSGLAARITAPAGGEAAGESSPFTGVSRPRLEPEHDGASVSARLPFVPLRRTGSRLPIFFVHPAGGLSLCYRGLALELGEDQPCFGLDAPGIFVGDAPLERVEDLAAHHADSILRAGVRGPFLIGGWSAGGTIAFELAHVLGELGHEVRLVTLFDPSAPAFAQAATADVERLDLIELAELYGLALDAAELATCPEVERHRHLLLRGKAVGIFPPSFEPSQLARLLGVAAGNIRAIRRYRPRYYPGRVVSFRASGVQWDEATSSAPFSGEDPDPSLGWSGLARDFTLEIVAGRHAQLMTDPYVRGLAKRLRAHLDR
jgi:thioesterase domain-containing protein